MRYLFGPFVLSPARRVLRRDGRDVALIPRYLDLLILLVAQRDRAVNRQEIFDRVWSDVVVSDSALTQAIRTIRRALDDEPRVPRFIRTVSRHGYQFVYPDVVEAPDEGGWVAAPAPTAASPDLAVVQVAAGAPEAGRGPAADAPSPAAPHAPEADPFAPLLAVLLREPPHGRATEDERYDAAIALHELGTDEALRRLDERAGHEQARAILRDARWDAARAGAVPLLSAPGRARVILGVVRLRARHAARLAWARWAAASAGGGVAGVVAGLAGGTALALVPRSETSVGVSIALAIVGGVAGALGGAGAGAGLAGAEALARSARAAALTIGAALGASMAGAIAHVAANAVLGGIFGRAVPELGGALEGLVVGAGLGLGYALATRRLAQGGMAAPRGPARVRAALMTGAVTAAAAVLLAITGRHLIGSTLDLLADTFNGSQVGLDPFARLLGEDSIRPVTRAIVSGFEGFMFGAGAAFGLMRRPNVGS